jgi:hypothetical protein
MFEKIKNWYMAVSNEMFKTYIKYFRDQGASLKIRNGKIYVTRNGNTMTYDGWEDLNNEYKLFPDQVTVQSVSNDREVNYWVRGNKERQGEILEFFKKEYNINPIYYKDAFNMNDYVYYFNSDGYLCATSSNLVIDILKQSKHDWVEFKLPEVRQLTKSDIAKMIGMNVDEFDIV